MAAVVSAPLRTDKVLGGGRETDEFGNFLPFEESSGESIDDPDDLLEAEFHSGAEMEAGSQKEASSDKDEAIRIETMEDAIFLGQTLLDPPDPSSRAYKISEKRMQQGTRMMHHTDGTVTLFSVDPTLFEGQTQEVLQAMAAWASVMTRAGAGQKAQLEASLAYRRKKRLASERANLKVVHAHKKARINARRELLLSKRLPWSLKPSKRFGVRGTKLDLSLGYDDLERMSSPVKEELLTEVDRTRERAEILAPGLRELEEAEQRDRARDSPSFSEQETDRLDQERESRSARNREEARREELEDAKLRADRVVTDESLREVLAAEQEQLRIDALEKEALRGAEALDELTQRMNALWDARNQVIPLGDYLLVVESVQRSLVTARNLLNVAPEGTMQTLRGNVTDITFLLEAGEVEREALRAVSKVEADASQLNVDTAEQRVATYEEYMRTPQELHGPVENGNEWYESLTDSVRKMRILMDTVREGIDEDERVVRAMGVSDRASTSLLTAVVNRITGSHVLTQASESIDATKARVAQALEEFEDVENEAYIRGKALLAWLDDPTVVRVLVESDSRSEDISTLESVLARAQPSMWAVAAAAAASTLLQGLDEEASAGLVVNPIPVRGAAEGAYKEFVTHVYANPAVAYSKEESLLESELDVIHTKLLKATPDISAVSALLVEVTGERVHEIWGDAPGELRKYAGPSGRLQLATSAITVHNLAHYGEDIETYGMSELELPMDERVNYATSHLVTRNLASTTGTRGLSVSRIGQDAYAYGLLYAAVGGDATLSESEILTLATLRSAIREGLEPKRALFKKYEQTFIRDDLLLPAVSSDETPITSATQMALHTALDASRLADWAIGEDHVSSQTRGAHKDLLAHLRAARVPKPVFVLEDEMESGWAVGGGDGEGDGEWAT